MIGVGRSPSESVRVPVIRTVGGLVKRLGRVLLWLLVVVLLLRGLASVLEPAKPTPAVDAARLAPTWPDDDARAFAADFARAYLSFSPKHADASARAVRALAAPELVDAIAPDYGDRAPRRTVASVMVARAARLDARHALVTVAAIVEGTSATVYLTVPVARDGRAAGAALPLYAGAELVDRAANLLAEGAVLVDDSERRWRVFHERLDAIRRKSRRCS